MILTLFTLVMAFLFLVCQVIVLVHLFRDFGPFSTFFGFCCVLYSYLWGWSAWKDSPLKFPVMIAWTLVMVVYFIGHVIISFFVN